MLFQCHSCDQLRLSFHSTCPICGPGKQDNNIPLDPEYYPEFQYTSQGLMRDLFLKKKTEKALESKLNSVLEKYRKFERPYFVNFVHYAGTVGNDNKDRNEYSDHDLFQSVLLGLGFGELRELPDLTRKLVSSTRFRFEYRSFGERAARHIVLDKGRLVIVNSGNGAARNAQIGLNLRLTLRSWIEEQGSAFRRELPLLLYYLWEQKICTAEIAFSQKSLPLIEDIEVDRIQQICESLYFEILVGRFKTRLENFDVSKFVTMYNVDSMDGHTFEEFLEKLFLVIGYDVQLGKRTADQGADLFAEKFGRKIVIQAKNYSDTVGNKAVQEVHSAKAFWNCDEAMVVTNNYFTASAKELAKSLSVKLVDRAGLQAYLDDYNQMIVQSSEGEVADITEFVEV